MNGAASSASVWRTHSTPDGRKYYYNQETKQTQWNRPAELGSAEEDNPSNWSEVQTKDGKTYWWNKQTNETTWAQPEALKNGQAAQTPSIPAKPPQPSNQFVAGSSFQSNSYPSQQQRDDYGPPDRRGQDRERPSNFGSHELRGNFVSSAAPSNDPEYHSFEEAEGAFMKLLKRSGVQPDWSWERTMRAIVKDPQYRALKDPKERKVAFEKFAQESRAQDKEREKERMTKLREDFTKMLKSHPEIKHFTRWKTARPIIEGETIFRSAGDDTERRQLFEEYIQSLKKAHVEQEASKRSSALDDLSSILQSLNLEPYTRWSDARGMLENDERLVNEDKFKSLSKSDVLTAFENHIKSLERSFNDSRQLQKSQRTRRERRNRDGFNELLRELQTGGKIKADTRWKDVQPIIEDDSRYVAILGQSGSTPLDLFWDVVDEEEKALKSKRNEALDVLDDKRYELITKSTLEDFMSVMNSDRRTSSMDPHDLKLIYQKLLDKVVQREKQDKAEAEKQTQKDIDRLRSRLKKLEPPIRATDSWEDVQPRVEKSDEYSALPTDDLRRAAFDRHIARLKEKDRDYDRHSRRSDRERDRERERDRGDRRGATRGSRTPEVDAYEAERRKAVADRERSYRKASSGLTPPPGGRRGGGDAREADRWDRGAGRLGSGAYERESRRERERDLDRERGYGSSRADPRDGPSRELDYGESGRAGSSMSGTPSGVRRRRSSGEDGDGDDGSGARRDSKRTRREDRTPDTKGAGKEEKEKDKVVAMEVEKEEETNYKSGSEEGEIEEE